jgi:dTDP-4-amino-4,6-dideoxygalactose transaminase
LQPLAASGKIILPYLPDYATNNAHMFYIVTHKFNERERIISELKKNDILSVFHYLSLHKSEFYKSYNPEVAASSLPMCDHYSDCLLRLPFYFELTDEDVIRICAIIVSLYQ